MSTKNKSQNNMKHSHQEHAAELLQQLQLLLSSGKNGGLCDVVLIAGKNGQRVPAHRVILAACSPYFRTMFSGDMLESNAAEITLGDDVHGDILLPLIKFCYTGEIEICAETVDELARTAHRLQLNAVVSGCSKYMKRHLDASNCLGVAALADLLSLNNLKQSAVKYAFKYFLQVSLQEEFLQLSFDRLKVLIASDHLKVPTEEVVFHSVMSWVRYEIDEEVKRTKHIPALLALVRLSVMPQTFLAAQGLIWNLCHEHSVCLPLLKEALEEANVPIRSRRIKPRNSMRPSLLALWRDNGQKHIRIAEYSPDKDEWNLFEKTFSSSRTSFAAAFFNNELIVVGGRNRHHDLEDSRHEDHNYRDGDYSPVQLNYLDTVESINLDTMKSTKLPSMRRGRDGHSIAVLDGLLYAVGGSEDNYGDVLESVERYNPNDRRWSSVAPMSVGRASFQLAVLNGRLFAAGGEEYNTRKLIECYDPQTNKWTQVANFNIPRESFAFASDNAFLYAVGGHDKDYKAVKSIERYDPQTDKWTEICELSSPKSSGSCVFLDDRLLVLIAPNEFEKELQEYNPLTGTWRELATLSTRNRCNLFLFIASSCTFQPKIVMEIE